MKNLTILTLVLSMMIGFNANAKKKKKSNGFAGTITFKISYEGRELSGDEQAQLPNKQIAYYTEDKEMVKVITPMGYVKIITDYALNKITVIFDQMGQSMFGTFDKPVDKDEDVTINKLDGTKTIAGYKCKKAEIITKKADKEIKEIAYYCEDLKSAHPDKNDEELGGVVLQLETEMGEGDDALTKVTTAIEVKSGKIKPVEFLQPSGAMELNEEQMGQIKQMLGIDE